MLMLPFVLVVVAAQAQGECRCCHNVKTDILGPLKISRKNFDCRRSAGKNLQRIHMRYSARGSAEKFTRRMYYAYIQYVCVYTCLI